MVTMITLITIITTSFDKNRRHPNFPLFWFRNQHDSVAVLASTFTFNLMLFFKRMTSSFATSSNVNQQSFLHVRKTFACHYVIVTYVNVNELQLSNVLLLSFLLCYIFLKIFTFFSSFLENSCGTFDNYFVFSNLLQIVSFIQFLLLSTLSLLLFFFLGVFLFIIIFLIFYFLSNFFLAWHNYFHVRFSPHSQTFFAVCILVLADPLFIATNIFLMQQQDVPWLSVAKSFAFYSVI